MKKLIVILALFATAPIIAQVPTNGLVDYYPFSGNANDASGNNYNGTNHGATLVNDRFGNPHSAYSFVTGGYIDCNNILDGTFAGPGKKFSISFWVKPDDTNLNNTILAKHADAACGEDEREFLIRELNNQINFEYYGDNYGTIGRFICGSATLTTYSKWYHVVVTYDGTINTNNGTDRVSIYVDDAPQTISTCRQGIGSFPFDIINGASHIGIGNYLTGAGVQCDEIRRYKGAIDDIRIYNRIVSDAEVDQLYQEITGINSLAYNHAIKIYPNPTGDKITIDYEGYSNLTRCSLRINNPLGQQVFESGISQQQSIVDLKGLNGKGLYFVYTIDEKGNTVDVKKIVLQ
jgi:hypothetical protein